MRSKEKGFTLVELIVGMAISSIIMVVLSMMFVINFRYIATQSALSERIAEVESIVVPLRKNLKNAVEDFWVDPLTSAIDTPTTNIKFKTMGPSSYQTLHYYLESGSLYYTIDGGTRHRLLTNVTNLRLLADDLSDRTGFDDILPANPNATVLDGNGFNQTLRSYTLMIEVEYPSLIKMKGVDFQGNETPNNRHHRYIQFYAPAAYI